MSTRSLAKAAGLTLRLEQGQDITLADGALDVADDLARGLVHELNLDLRGDKKKESGCVSESITS